jgi:hypothetical protein
MTDPLSAARNVFGPDRTRLAIHAIDDLAAARAIVANVGWVASDADYARLAQAQAVRDTFTEYGDTFRGH